MLRNYLGPCKPKKGGETVMEHHCFIEWYITEYVLQRIDYGKSNFMRRFAETIVS